MSTHALPFELSVASVTDWLESLNQLNNVNSANQLNVSVNCLRKLDTETDKVYEVLIQLIPTVLYITSLIESSLLVKTNKKISNTSRKVGKLCIQLLKNLSLAFHACAYDKALSSNKKNLSIYIALQLIGHVQRITAVFYESPSATLWVKMGELYTLARKRSIVGEEITHQIKGLNHSTMIGILLKQNLLFAMLTPHHYVAEDIKSLFLISEQKAYLLDLNFEYSDDNIFSWDIKLGSPPYPINQNLTNNNLNTNININTYALVSFLQSIRSFLTLTEEMLEQMVNQLSGYRKVMTATPSSILNVNYLLIGYTKIVAYLEQIEKFNKIQKLGSEPIEATDFGVAEFGITGSEQDEFKTDIFGFSELKTKVSASKDKMNLPTNAPIVKILETNFEQYSIAIIQHIDCSIGDIVLLCDANFNFVFGIIRQIKREPSIHITRLLIEKMSGTPSLYLISSTQIPEQQMIGLKTQHSTPELFIPPCKLTNGTHIELDLEQCIIDKLIDYSPFYMHYFTCDQN